MWGNRLAFEGVRKVGLALLSCGYWGTLEGL